MENKKYKILIVASWYPDGISSLEGSFIKEQVEMLSNNGHDVTVLHSYLLGSFKNTFSKRTKISICKENNSTIIRIGVPPSLPAARGLAYKKVLNSSIRVLSKNQFGKDSFDTIHSHAMFLGGYIGTNLSKIWGIPCVHTEHTSGLIFATKQYNSIDKNIIEDIYKTSNRVLFVSEYAKIETLKKWGVDEKSSHLVVHNVVDDSFFKFSLENKDNTTFNYIIISNLIPRKGVSLLIKSWSLLLKEFPNSQLTIAGEGSEKLNLIELSNKLKLDESVKFIPTLNRQEVKEYLSKNHVLVSSSKLETFGLTVAEAQAMGMPVVVTDSGGVRDIVTDFSGIITRHTEHDLAMGLIEIQNKYQNFNKARIKENAYQNFSSESILQKLETIYRSVSLDSI
jgi:glycosyltransferase involved in cell wall biosynthesis